MKANAEFGELLTDLAAARESGSAAAVLAAQTAIDRYLGRMGRDSRTFRPKGKRFGKVRRPGILADEHLAEYN